MPPPPSRGSPDSAPGGRVEFKGGGLGLFSGVAAGHYLEEKRKMFEAKGKEVDAEDFGHQITSLKGEVKDRIGLDFLQLFATKFLSSTDGKELSDKINNDVSYAVQESSTDPVSLEIKRLLKSPKIVGEMGTETKTKEGKKEGKISILACRKAHCLAMAASGPQTKGTKRLLQALAEFCNATIEISVASSKNVARYSSSSPDYTITLSWNQSVFTLVLPLTQKSNQPDRILTKVEEKQGTRRDANKDYQRRENPNRRENKVHVRQALPDLPREAPALNKERTRNARNPTPNRKSDNMQSANDAPYSPTDTVPSLPRKPPALHGGTVSSRRTSHSSAGGRFDPDDAPGKSFIMATGLPDDSESEGTPIKVSLGGLKQPSSLVLQLMYVGVLGQQSDIRNVDPSYPLGAVVKDICAKLNIPAYKLEVTTTNNMRVLDDHLEAVGVLPCESNGVRVLIVRYIGD
ncbi:hypothetical protein AAMO2058_001349900 [Amorphochlora amoebiformis]